MDDLCVRPEIIDEGSYLRVRQTRPVARAASPVIDHSIELTDAAIACSDWYRGETLVVPMEYLSLLLNPDRNGAGEKLARFAETVKTFKPGAFPGHCSPVRELQFTARFLICKLSAMVSGAQGVFADSLKHLGAFFATISDPCACMLSTHDFVQRVDAKLSGLLESYRGISRVFEQREHEIKFGAAGSGPMAEALELARDTNVRVRRMDARGLKRGEREKARELQEACYRYWELGCGKDAVKNACNGRARYEDVYTYYRRELSAIGVGTCEEFARLLVRRQKRLSQIAHG